MNLHSDCIRVFLSSSTPANDIELGIKQFVTQTLIDCQCMVVDGVMVPNGYDILDEVNRATLRADAVVCLAFPRVPINHNDNAFEYAASPWIHVEAALAFAHRKPLMLIESQGLAKHGILDPSSVRCVRLRIEETALSKASKQRLGLGLEDFISTIRLQLHNHSYEAMTSEI